MVTRSNSLIEQLEDRTLLAATLSVTLDGSNNLSITDGDLTGKVNNLSISNDGTGNIVISDAVEAFISNGNIAGAVLSNGDKTLTVPVASITGTQVIINGALGNDSLSASLANSLGKPLIFNGGTGGNDSLSLGGGTTTTVTHSLTNANDGSITLAGALAGTINYTGLEPITDNLNVVNRVFTFNGGAETITVTDGTASDGKTMIDSSLSESVYFVKPTGSLTINAGTGNDTVTITSVDAAYNVDLTINGDAGGDTVNLNGDITFASGENLDVNLTNDASGGDVDSITLGTNANLAASGAGTINLQASRSIALASGSSITTVNGNLDVNANQQGTPTTGNFIGVNVDNGLIQATGTGAVTVKGRGGNDVAGTQIGVRVQAGGDIIGGTSGLLTVQGTGGASAGNNNHGVLVTGAGTTIMSGGASISVIGAANGTGTSHDNYGVFAASGGQMVATGSASLTVNGTGAATSGSFNEGVIVNATSLIGTVDGSLSVTGAGLGTGTGAAGVDVYNGGLISATGSGTVTITGTGSATGTGTENYGVWIETATARISSNTGAIQITATAGGGSAAFKMDTGTSTLTTTNAPITVIANSMAIDSAAVLTAGTSNSVTLRQNTNGTNINLGGADALTGSPLTLGLTDAELDRITAGTINFGNANSGAITVSAAVSRSAATTLNLTTGNNITFGAAGSLNAGAAPVTLTAASGSINGDAAKKTDITASTLTATSSSGIGSTDAIETAVSTVSFTNTTNQVQVSNTQSTGLTVSGTNAGTGTFNLTENSGNLTIGAADINTNSGAVNLTVTGANKSIIAASGSDLVTTNSGTGAGVTLIADNMNLGGNITAGTGTVTLRQSTNGTTIDLGSSSGPTNGTLELSDAELDRITAGTLSIGNTSSGVITVSAAVSRSTATTLNLTTGNNMTFGAAGSLNVGAAPVTLSAASGSINGDAAKKTDITASTLTATSSSGIGSTDAIETAVSTVSFTNTTNQVQVSNTQSTGLTVSGTNAGTGTFNLTENSGNLTIDAADIITNSGAVNLTVTGANKSIIAASGSDLVTTNSGTGAAVTLIADNMNLGGNVTAGTGTATLRQGTNGTAIDLGSSGGPTNGKLELSDAELDRITAGTISIGNSNSGAITFSADITRATNTNVNLSTSANSNIAFSSFSLNAGSGGDVSLTTSGSGAITTGNNSGTDLTADDVTFSAGSNGIGSTTNFLRLAATTVVATTTGNGSINLVEADSINIAANDLNAGAGTITLGGGTFLTTASGSLLSPAVVKSGATLGGTGTTTAITTQSGGNVTPGTSPGILNSGNVTLVSGSNFNIELNGTALGTQYDQLNVTGTVALGGANLVLTIGGGFAPVDGVSFVIVNNDASDAITGTFFVGGVSIPNEGAFVSGGNRFIISYTSGINSNDISLTVANNGPPTDIAISSNAVAENVPTATVVGTFSTTDPDSGNTFTYALVTGNGDTNNSSFTIEGSTLKTNAVFNFEAKNSYSIRVRSTDQGGLSVDKVFTISITNVTEMGGINVQLGQSQRSYLRYLDVLFDQPNDLLNMINNGRFQLTKRDLNGASPANIPLTPSMLTPVGNNVRLDFGTNGLGGNRSTNAGDGYYEIGVDMDGNGSFESTKFFYRLLGDVNGDRKVDSTDSSLVLAAYGKTNAERDVNGDGIVNANDRTLVLRAVGRKLKDDLFADD